LDCGQRADWFDASWVCIFIIIAASSLILRVFRELRFPEPILDLSILKIPLFDVSISLIPVMIFVVYALSLLNPLFFKSCWATRHGNPESRYCRAVSAV
jgi:hypothetical protein